MGATPVWEQARAVGSLDRRLIGTTSSVPKSPKKTLAPSAPSAFRVASLMMPHVPAANRPSLLKEPARAAGRTGRSWAAGSGSHSKETFSSPPPAEHFSVVVCLFHQSLVSTYTIW